MNKRKFLLATMALASSQVFADDGQQTVKIFMGFAAGGNGDLIARLLAEELRPLLGKNVIVENRPGAAGRIAALALKNSPPDGNHFMLQPDSWALFPTLLNTEQQLKYSLKNDFTPVARIVTYPLGFFVSSDLKVNNLKEYIEKTKQDPKLAVYGSSGSGGISEFLGKVMSQEVGVKITHIPFKGGSESRQQLLAGQIPAAIMTPGDGLGDSNGKIKPIGFFTPERWSLAGDIPTMKEQGYALENGGAFSAIWASAQTPAAARQKMQDALHTVLQKPSVHERLARIHAKADFAEGAAVQQEIDHLLAYWAPIVKP